MQDISNLKFVWNLVFWFALVLSQPIAAEVYRLDSINTPKDWFNLDPEENGIMGTSVNKAYALLLKDKNPKKTVVVAVIDSGVDINHEDLQGRIWVNQDEIPGNGIDDDKNGYKDDVNGWNFIGGEDGTNISTDSYELTREYARLKPVYENLSPDQVRKKDEGEYQYWLAVQKEFVETKKEAEMNHQFTSSIQENLTEVAEVLREALGKDTLRAEDLKGLQNLDERVMKVAEMVLQIFDQMGGQGTSFRDILSDLAAEVEYYATQVEYAYNPGFDPRHIVGDNPANYKEKFYGNNDVIGPDASHGTHVAGIIAANRNNSLGMKGIAEHAYIMPIRAVPDGDERDKDVANAIYYAVDNGADIINMSFGKSFSPGKKYVDKAVKYARKKGVLLIHAAGNDGEEVRRFHNFPNKWVGKRRVASNWLEVGASGRLEDETLPGVFSNYSGKAVDFFAPGVGVYSTVPGNEYQANSGTSMAAPVVSGITALIMAYFPELKPSEIREILLESVYIPQDGMVNKPGKGEEVDFGTLSITGGVVNAYKALKLAEIRAGTD